MSTPLNVQQAQQGDREAFVRLIRAYEANMYAFSRTMLSSDEDCADAIQETILLAYRSITTLRELAYFKTWLFRILIHECSRIRKNKAKHQLLASDINNHPEKTLAYEAIDIQDAVQRLEPSIRIVIQLYYFEDLTVKQIAEMIDIREGTVKSRLHRARTLLGEYLTDSEKEIEYETC
ncbi:sigma-70 family RNA polymerase sigma factor [Paenibacillus arenosi]|uniref:Sigma-70 family RNA polymerase sigma factor n=1 Tax=Paenibacillus arenosi TaxID=2774142 RepID=A0ABR9AYP7_9BACL|nr:sigma-70 family RNA polymerase sigma factor [Paenibacillus arenosi]